MIPNRFSESFAIGASLRGKSHIELHLPNQDRVLYISRPNLLLIAAADGVGSSRWAHEGAFSAICAVRETFVRLQRNRIREDRILQTINRLYCQGVPYEHRSDAATTCLYAAMINNTLYIGQAGDGLCAVCTESGIKQLRSSKGTFANEVFPLRADRDNSKLWHTYIIHPDEYQFIRVLLATDGVADDILPGQKKQFMDMMISAISGQRQKDKRRTLLTILHEWPVPASNDDKTIAVMKWGEDYADT